MSPTHAQTLTALVLATATGASATAPTCADVQLAFSGSGCCGATDPSTVHVPEFTYALPTLYETGSSGFDFFNAAATLGSRLSFPSVQESTTWSDDVMYTPLYYGLVGSGNIFMYLTSGTPGILMTPEQYIDWYYSGGGKAVVDAMFAARTDYFGVLAGMTSAQNLIWTKDTHPLNSLTDLQSVGSSYRTIGLCHDYMQNVTGAARSDSSLDNVYFEHLSMHYDVGQAWVQQGGVTAYKGPWCENFGAYYLVMRKSVWNAMSTALQSAIVVASEAGARASLAAATVADAVAEAAYAGTVSSIPTDIVANQRAWYAAKLAVDEVAFSTEELAVVTSMQSYLSTR